MQDGEHNDAIADDAVVCAIVTDPQTLERRDNSG
jgi:hypothetical protein